MLVHFRVPDGEVIYWRLATQRTLIQINPWGVRISFIP